jgi:hypothetical protein
MAAKDEPPRPYPSDRLSGLSELTETQLVLVQSVVDALNVPISFQGGDSSTFVDSRFAETMANFLVLHHSLHEEPLNKKPFEYVFKQCLISQGTPAELNNNPGAYPHDVFGAGLRWSLKTEAAAKMSLKQIKIEKFMEARWIRECVTPDACSEAVRERLPRHLSGYDRILVMRAFTRPTEFIYRLEEVPVETLVECFTRAAPEEFRKNEARKSPSFGADLFYPGHTRRTFRMLLDSSVEKVRLWYASEHAVNHGTWIIPKRNELSVEA